MKFGGGLRNGRRCFCGDGGYLLISFDAVKAAIAYARKNGKRAWVWGSSAALIMYLIPFWDWVPTVVMHRYYCATEAGFWVYKTPEQWMKENPGVMEALVANKDWPSRHEERDGGREKIDIDLANDRFNIVVIQRDVTEVLPIIRRQEEFKDLGTNEILARYIDFSAGNSVAHTGTPPGPLKFWLGEAHCAATPELAVSSRKWMNQFRGVEQ